jgi:sugar/nucleoside kinase (ribokinase family)
MDEGATGTETREAVDACRQALPAEFDGGDLAFGFDGIVDNVRVMVETRHSPSAFDRLETLAALRDRVNESLAAESSLTVEWEQEGTRTGGHACHLARTFDELGAATTMVGTYGQPPTEPFTTEFADSTLVSVGEPGYCDAVEFDDGKLLLVESGDAAGLDWPTLCDRLDPDELATHLDGTDVFGVGYWAVTSVLPSLVASVVAETWERQASPPDILFFDPGDIRSLPAKTLREGATRLAEANETVPVTVSANRSETEALASTLADEEGDCLADAAETALDALGVDRFVCHSASRSVTVSETGTATVEVPRTDSPAMTTSAGDHFNAGYLVGDLAGLSDAACTVLGNASAGRFVRTGSTPTYEGIREFVDGYLDRF